MEKKTGENSTPPPGISILSPARSLSFSLPFSRYIPRSLSLPLFISLPLSEFCEFFLSLSLSCSLLSSSSSSFPSPSHYCCCSAAVSAAISAGLRPCVAAAITAGGSAPCICLRRAAALATVSGTAEAAPAPPAVAAFARELVQGREAALVDLAALQALFAPAIAAAAPEDKLALCVAQAGLVSHGLALAHTQGRLKAAQWQSACT